MKDQLMIPVEVINLIISYCEIRCISCNRKNMNIIYLDKEYESRFIYLCTNCIKINVKFLWNLFNDSYYKRMKYFKNEFKRDNVNPNVYNIILKNQRRILMNQIKEEENQYYEEYEKLKNTKPKTIYKILYKL